MASRKATNTRVLVQELMLATERCHQESRAFLALEALLQREVQSLRATSNYWNPWLRTCDMLAAVQDMRAVVNVCARSSKMRGSVIAPQLTPLHAAAAHGLYSTDWRHKRSVPTEELVHLLLRCGSDPTIRELAKVYGSFASL